MKGNEPMLSRSDSKRILLFSFLVLLGWFIMVYLLRGPDQVGVALSPLPGASSSPSTGTSTH